MNYNDSIEIIVEERIADGYGGFITTERELTTLKCKVAPYRVQSGDIYKIPNPTASVKFFTPKLPFDEDETFIIIHRGKRYRKLAVADYGKVTMIIGERI